MSIKSLGRILLRAGKQSLQRLLTIKRLSKGEHKIFYPSFIDYIFSTVNFAAHVNSKHAEIVFKVSK